MVKTPFFSVIIPTKNRSDLISNAIKSILNQSFNNYEIIITDNDDTESTYNVISKFSDPKIKYFRTGNLSMPDNWEYALQFVSGEYITVLTDRCVFKPRSLEIIYDEIINSNASVISWTSDSFGYDDNQTEYAKRNCSGKRIRFDSKELLNSFVRFGKHGNCLPKLLNSCCKRTIVDLIRNSNKNRFFPPVSPDFTSCFLQLLFIDDILYIDEGLFISCYGSSRGNGSQYRRKLPARDIFLKEINKNNNNIILNKLSFNTELFTITLVINDLLVIIDNFPEKNKDIKIDWGFIYLQCLREIYSNIMLGIDMNEEIDILFSVINNADEVIKSKVTSNQMYKFIYLFKKNTLNSLLKYTVPVLRYFSKKAYQLIRPYRPNFTSVFEAIDWSEANHASHQIKN